MAANKTMVLLPVFNDWASAQKMLVNIDQAFHDAGITVAVTFVNDGSTDPVPDDFVAAGSLRSIESVRLIDLACNLGHQQALAVGLAELTKDGEYANVVVMDADGEDNPGDIPALLQAAGNSEKHIVLAQRASRRESLLFKLSYRVFQNVFRLLTGHTYSFGNFCVIPRAHLDRLTFMSNLWNSLPATILSSKLPLELVPIHRQSRYHGRSQMNFTSLAIHGLRAIAVFADSVAVRMSFLLMGSACVAIAVIIGLRIFGTGLAPGWASSMVGFLILIALQIIILFISTSLSALQTRGLMQMVPAVHAHIYVRQNLTLYGDD